MVSTCIANKQTIVSNIKKCIVNFSLRVHGDLGDQGEEGRVREAAEGGRLRRDGRGHQGRRGDRGLLPAQEDAASCQLKSRFFPVRVSPVLHQGKQKRREKIYMNVSSDIYSSGRQKLDLRKPTTPKTFSLSALTSLMNTVSLKTLKVHTYVCMYVYVIRHVESVFAKLNF